MKKVFPLTAPGKADARVVEAVKSDVRRYVKRERAKAPPAGFDTWTFACQVGATRDDAVPCELAGIGAAIDGVVQTGSPAVYVEVVATPSHRVPPPA